MSTRQVNCAVVLFIYGCAANPLRASETVDIKDMLIEGDKTKCEQLLKTEENCRSQKIAILRAIISSPDSKKEARKYAILILGKLKAVEAVEAVEAVDTLINTIEFSTYVARDEDELPPAVQEQYPAVAALLDIGACAIGHL